ncbi:hypothetical protein MP228_003204 [Amoeboaphelidium protococcarum]|nr:hypothetical protein MP228_003204 [Amoeboaphelidium protococcarum]
MTVFNKALTCALLLTISQFIHAAVPVIGGGSTFQTDIQIIFNDYYAFSLNSTGVVSYNSTGSSAGLSQTIAGLYMFGGSDFRPPVGSAVQAIPIYAGGVSVVYNVPELQSANINLRLSRSALVGIFSGQVKKWNDPLIVAANPLATSTLPDQNITIVRRSDGSGTTFAFTSGLSSVDSTTWVYGGNTVFNWTWAQNIAAAGSSGVAKNVLGLRYSIGYVDSYIATDYQIQSAFIQNKKLEYIEPSSQSINAGFQRIQGANFDTQDFIDVDETGAYPFVVFTYNLLNDNMKQFFSITQVRETLKYLYWCLTDNFATNSLLANTLIPVQQNIRDVNLNLLKTYKYGDVQVFGQSPCDAPNQCKNGGQCSVIYPFTDPVVKCKCNALFTNVINSDCSELSPGEFVDLPQLPAVLMTIFALAGILYTIVMGLMLVTRADHPVVKAMSPFFCFWILAGCILSYVSVFLFIGEPNNFTCGARPWFLSTAFGAVFGMLAAKTWRIYSIFGNVKRMEESLTNLNLFIRFGGVVLSSEWLLAIIWSGAGILQPYNTFAENGLSVARTCASLNGDLQTAMSVLFYLSNAALLAFCIYLAYKTRNYQYQYNENREISLTLSLITFQLVIGIPLTYVVALDHEAVFVITAVTLTLVPFTVTTVMFGPKFYSLYLAKFFKKEGAYDIGKSTFGASATNASTATGGAALRKSTEILPSGLSFWHCSLKRNRIGSPWFMCTIAIVPEINWIAFVDDWANSSPKVYEVFKFTDVSFSDQVPKGQDPETSTLLKVGAVEYIMEVKTKEYMAKFNKVLSKVQHGAEANVKIKNTATGESVKQPATIDRSAKIDRTANEKKMTIVESDKL